MRFDLPSATRNPISLIGAAITTAAAVVFLVLLALEMAGQLRNPYLGLLLFVAVPAVFVFGLLLIPVGAWRQRRRVAAGLADGDWPVIDLRLPRTQIPWVRLTDRQGNVKEYTIEGTGPEALAVAALKDSYPSHDAAMAGIERRLREVYQPRAGDSAETLARTIAGVQAVYARNVFPTMKVGWGTYPNNLGHVFANGCFRCHDDKHTAPDGSVIKQDCESCHAIP